MFNYEGKEYDNVWFTSDEHYGSIRAIELSKRMPYEKTMSDKYKIKTMTELIIKNHNSVVGKNDIVFHIGDFGDYEIVKRLNGHHVLIMGNYEEDDFTNQLRTSDDEDMFFNNLKSIGFIDVRWSYIIKDHNFGKIRRQDGTDVNILFLTHEPRNCIYFKDLKSTFNTMNLFGHIHEKCKCKVFGLNVGIDCNHFYPVSSEDVVFYLNAILNHYDKNVFI